MSLYVPALAGTAMDVAVPAALVIVGLQRKCVVPAGANHTVFAGSPVLRIVRLAVPTATEALAGNT